MKRWMIPCLALTMAVIWANAPAPVFAAGPLVEQSIPLHPGWNAVFLEVRPVNDDPAEVFKGLPVAAVWAWIPRTTAIQFIRNPGEEMLRDQGWHVWFPPTAGDKAALTNLGAILGNRAYLVQLAGDVPVRWTARGRVAVRAPRWVPDSFNFTGVTVDHAAPPTYEKYFAASDAHRGQAIYRLTEQGTWSLLDAPAATPTRPGEAFWIYTNGASSYAGPLSVQLDSGDELDFPPPGAKREIRIRNATAAAKTAVMRLAGGGAALPLARAKLGDSGLMTWPALASESTVELDPGDEKTVRLSLRSLEVPAAGASGIIEITDGEGSLARVSVSAPAPELINGEPDHTGLWIGTVEVDRVTEAQIPSRPAFTTPTAVGYAFSFRVIVHVDAAGQARLLKEVTQIWKSDLQACVDSSTTCPCNGDPARSCGGYVLVSDDRLIPGLLPPTGSAAPPPPHRISTVAYDFDGSQVSLNGAFSSTGSLSGAIAVPATLPTNPFLHRYHPDHNNRDELGDPITNPQLMEAYAVQRAITLAFTADRAVCEKIIGCGSETEWLGSTMAGTYQETVTGLHRNPIKTAGTFTLRRVSTVAQLNPTATP